MSETAGSFDGGVQIESAAIASHGVTQATPRIRKGAAPARQPAFPQDSGPSLSYELLRHSDRWIPSFVFRILMRMGAGVALLVMPEERRNSRSYLTTVLGRPARLIEIWRHFFAYTEMFVLRSQLAEGRPHDCRTLPSCD